MPAYNAEQIIGMTLIARKSVDLTRLPNDGAKAIYTVEPGETVGVVYSYIGGNGSPLWWMFYDKNQKTYYVKHDAGRFDVQNLRDQGALSVQEETEQRKKEDEDSGGFNPFGDLGKDLGKAAKVGVFIIAGALALSFLRK